MPRTFASKKTKSTVLALIGSKLTPMGYAEFTRDPETLRTEYRRHLNQDVTLGLQLQFSDGTTAGANLTHMQATFGLASRELLSIYFRLHGESYRDNFLPIGGSLRPFAPLQDGSWFFDLPNRTEHVEHFSSVVERQLHPISESLDSARKQIQELLEPRRKDVHWNDFFFRPISLLYLGQHRSAVDAARSVLANARSKEFANAYQTFFERLVAEA